MQKKVNKREIQDSVHLSKEPQICMDPLTFTRAFVLQNLARAKCDCWMLFKSDTKPEVHTYLLYNEHGPWHCVGSS